MDLRNVLLMVLLYIFCTALAPVYAKSGCCSQHGGVAGCNTATGFQSCKDGSTSPSCKCDNSTVKPVKQTTAKTTPKKEAPVKEITTTVAAKAGCCSGHGGVGSCDKKSGFYKCKDGSKSGTCKCLEKTKKT